MKTVKLISVFWTANPSFAPNLFAKALAQAKKYLRSSRAARDSVLKTLTRLKNRKQKLRMSNLIIGETNKYKPSLVEVTF